MAQKKSQSPKERFIEAESNFLYEEYDEALPIYARLKDEFPDNYTLDYRIGRCYLNIPYETRKSVRYLETAVKHMTGEYQREGNWNEKRPPLDALFYLAEAYRVNNMLDKAISTYREFKSKASDKKYDIPYVDFHIKTCQRAAELMKNPVWMIETSVGPNINTRFSEMNPVVSRDESVMVYAAKLPFYQAVFYVRKDGGNWGHPVNIMSDLGVDDDCLPTCISSDGTELYLYRSDQFKGDLYVSNLKNGKWTKVRKLNGNINTKYWESHASLSSDGKKLYFTSNRDGGYGGLDVYVSERTSGDNWGQPRNLGPIINSMYNEESPFISDDGKRLFFSSYGHDNMGGYDIFYSNLNSDGSWAEPVNMGYPVNTTDDDCFYCPEGAGEIGYMEKFLPKGNGRTDIVRLKVSLTKPVQKTETKVSANLSFGKLAVINSNRKDSVLYRSDKNTRALNDNAAGTGINLNDQGWASQIVGISGLKATGDAIVGKSDANVIIQEKSDSARVKTVQKSGLAGDSVFGKGKSKVLAGSDSRTPKSIEKFSGFEKFEHFITERILLVVSSIIFCLLFILFIVYKRRHHKNNERE